MRRVSFAQKQIVGRRPACVLAVRGLGERPLEVPGPRAETRDGTARADEASRDLRRRPGPETRRPARSAPPSTRGLAERDIGSQPIRSSFEARGCETVSPKFRCDARHRSSLTAEQFGKTAVRKPGNVSI